MNALVSQESSALERYMSEVKRIPMLSREEEDTLARRFRDHGDVDAAHKLVTANLRFVVKVAYQFKAYGMKMLDLVQEGNLGLMRAVQKFNPDRGYRLISYAVWWIKAYIQNYILRNWSLVKLGTTQAQRKLFFNLNKEKARLSAMGIDPTPEVIAGFSGSYGMPFLLQVMWARPSRASASLPVRPLGRRSTSITWLSVRPETMRRPRSISVSASTLALATTCCW